MFFSKNAPRSFSCRIKTPLSHEYIVEISKVALQTTLSRTNRNLKRSFLGVSYRNELMMSCSLSPTH